MADLRVSFPEPCSEPWDGMEPRGCNRHCASCDKVVHDLAALTVAEAEGLLDEGDKVCVRAEIDDKGHIKTAANLRGRPSLIVACVGALLATACQTTPGGRVDGGHQLSGQVFATHFRGGSKIRNAAGDEAELRIDRYGRFDVRGLAPGTYTLDILDYCGARHEFTDIVVADADIDLGRLQLATDCIIVGQMVREEPTSRG